jgi:hypothetical protein
MSRRYGMLDHAWGDAMSVAHAGFAGVLAAVLERYARLLRKYPERFDFDALVVYAVSGVGAASTIPVLLAHGARADAIDPKHGLPVLVDAIEIRVQGALALTKALLQGGADPNGPPPGSHLVRALTKGSDDIVRLVLEHGADPNRVVEGRHPLQWAFHLNRRALVPLLIAHGASPEYAALVDPTFNPAALEHVPIKPPASLRARHSQGGPRP